MAGTMRFYLNQTRYTVLISSYWEGNAYIVEANVASNDPVSLVK
jgi:hypothetical protein